MNFLNDQDTRWQDLGLCVDLADDTMFPDREDIELPPLPDGVPYVDEEAAVTVLFDAAVAEAKIICGQCPVASDCLAYALANKIEYGIWGGNPPAERFELNGRMSTLGGAA